MEDDPADVRLLVERLRDSGLGRQFELIPAGSLAQAVARVGSEAVDVVVVDLGLPDTSGLATFRGIRQVVVDVPVLVLTGHEDDDLAQAAVREGAQDYLTKDPLTGWEFDRAVRYALERHHQQASTVRRQEVLLKVSRHATRGDEAARLFEHAAAAIVEGLGAARSVVAEHRDGQLHVRASAGWPQAPAGIEPVDAVTWGGFTLQSGAPVVVEDLRLEDRFHICAVSAEDPPGSGITVPIPRQGDTWGLLGAFFDQPRRFGAADVGFVEQLAALLSEALHRREAEAQLRDSRRWLQLLLEQIPALVYTVDTDLRVTSASGRQLPEMAATADGRVGMPLSAAMAEDDDVDPGMLLEPHRRAVAGESATYAGELGGRWWQGKAVPLTDAGGAVVGAVGLALDHTDEHRQRQQLVDSQTRLQALFDNALDAILVADDDARYVHANPAAADLLGYSAEELEDMQLTDLVDPGAADAARQAWTSFLAEGRQTGEFMLRRADGTEVTVEFRAVADVRPGMHLSVMRDVTARTRAQQALQASEQRFRQLAENATEGILRLRLTGRWGYEYVNPAVEEIVGVSAEQIYDDPLLLYRRLHPDDRPLIDECLRTPAHLDEVLQVRVQGPDRQWRWVELRSAPIHDEDGQLTAVQAIVVDITDHIQQQQALQTALQHEQDAAAELRRVGDLKDTFLRAVSHELRTPLTSVYGLATTLQRHGTSLPETQQADLLARLADSADRLRVLLDDLLDVSRLTHGTLQPELQDVDLARLAAAMADTIDFSGRQLHLHTEPTPLQAAGAKIERIIHNLLDNAVTHTPTDATIWLRVHQIADGALLTVEDNGPGIPDELHERIFEPFEQGPHTHDHANPGTGIGLNLVARFAELHGGRAWVENRPAGGATFRVLLPTDPTPDPA